MPLLNPGGNPASLTNTVSYYSDTGNLVLPPATPLNPNQKYTVAGTVAASSQAISGSGGSSVLGTTPAIITQFTTPAVLTIAVAGSYLVMGSANFFSGTSAVASITNINLYVGQNGAANLNSQGILTVPVCNSFYTTGTLDTINVIIAANVGDILSIFGSASLAATWATAGISSLSAIRVG